MYINKKIRALFAGIPIPGDPTALLGDRLVYQSKYSGYDVCFKTFSIAVHGPIVHEWCNQPYSRRFWGMQGSLKQLKAYYLEKARRLKEVQLMVYCHDYPVAFCELYRPADSILAMHTTTAQGDYGIHLLIAPYKMLLRTVGNLDSGFSDHILRLLLEYLFSNSAVGRVLAEPDKNNTNACRLAERVGFRFLKEIELPDKTANLFVFEKERFLQLYPRSSPHPLTPSPRGEGEVKA